MIIMLAPIAAGSTRISYSFQLGPVKIFLEKIL